MEQTINTEESTPVEEASFICCATYIPLRKWLYVLPFTWFTKHIESHLQKKASGYIRSEIRSDINILGLTIPKYSPLDGKYYQKRFWTYTVWRDRGSSLKFFADSPHHREAVKYFKKWTYPTARIVVWKTNSSDIDWKTGLEKLSQSSGIKDFHQDQEIAMKDYVPGERL